MTTSENKAGRAAVAVVTGGRRGIGRACVAALARAGFDLVLLDLVEDDETRGALAEVAAAGREGRFVAGDIADLNARSALTQRLFDCFGTIDCLVNNAGVLSNVRGGDLLDVTPENFDRVMNVNLRGTFFLTQAVAKRMVGEAEADRPVPRSIITISSGAVGRARQDSPEYAFSKTSLALMTQMFAVRLGRHGICTYDIRPGVTKTEMSRDVWPMYEQLIADGHFPIPRMALPEDVARAVATAASGGLSFNTGGHIYVDGGHHIPGAQAGVKRR
jgi:3-oxoacyl-[acyl-carrier protein] reductase